MKWSHLLFLMVKGFISLQVEGRPGSEYPNCLFVSHHQCIFHPFRSLLTVVLELWALKQGFSEFVLHSPVFRVNNLDPPHALSWSSLSPLLPPLAPLHGPIEADTRNQISTHIGVDLYGLAHLLHRGAPGHMTGYIFAGVDALVIRILLKHEVEFGKMTVSFD